MYDDTFLGVRQFQFRQEVPGVAVLRVVPVGGFGEEERRRIERNLNGKLDGRVRFSIDLVSEIQLTPSGQSTYVHQLIDLERMTATKALA